MIQFIKDLIDLVRWKRRHFQNHTLVFIYADGRKVISTMSTPPPDVFKIPTVKIHADPNNIPTEKDYRLFVLSTWTLSETGDGHHFYVFEEDSEGDK